MEIERKFKVLKLPNNIEKYEKAEIEQGYLCIKPTVRIRKNNNTYTLNYKYKDKMPLTKDNYEHLLSKVDNHMIIKTRYKVPIENELIAEIDVFHGNLEGLIFSEVEFKNISDSENFEKPEWIGEDISFDKRYDNTLLSRIDKYDKEYFK